MNTLIDTSAWIESFRKSGKESIRSKVQSLMISGEARITEPILLELYNGAQGQKEHKVMLELQESVPILSTSKEVYNESYMIAKLLRKKGVTVPAIDLLIFSVAQVHGCALFHNDSDYLLIQKWIPLNLSSERL